MAADEAQNTGESSETSPEPQTPPPGDTSPDGEGAQDGWWNEAQKRGFKTQDDVWKSYGESEKKITEQAETLKQAEKFEKEVAPVINAIWADEKLLASVRNKLQGTDDTPTPETKPETPDIKSDGKPKDTPSAPSSVDTETRNVLQQQLVNEFETEHGIDRLDDATRKDVRAIIGATMGRWVKPGTTPPLRQLKPLLEDAFTVASSKDEKLKNILKDMPPVQDPSASMPTMSSSAAPAGDDIQLTSDQEAVAKKMPGGIEGYKEGMKSLAKG